uniref:Uncharacterized protein n=1 Tax=Phaseolus vulgaris TaxID=3885 RepID=V7D3R7_PHAVU|nr:hypothetical protein PHAVU_L005600g [Phaseolus vulgaris]ESW35916.1 hypothetical protein PHAVU_L005600g [Phaseolus vulgaris]
MKLLVDCLASTGDPISLQIDVILEGLPQDYESIIDMLSDFGYGGAMAEGGGNADFSWQPMVAVFGILEC